MCYCVPLLTAPKGKTGARRYPDVTYGDLKFRLSQMFPGVSLDIIEGYIADVYRDILRELAWTRENVTTVLQTAAPYTTGTVTLTHGSTAVTGSGTTFTTAMTGRGFRATGRDEIYEFSYVSATAATLDRPFEGTTGSTGYKIFQFVYLLPSDCRLLEDSAFGPEIERVQHETGSTYGTPEIWQSYMDDASTPPRMQVKLYPIPDAAIGLPFTYQREEPALATGVTLLPWLQPSALVEGVTGKLCALPSVKDYVGAQYHASKAEIALTAMRAAEAHSMGPTEIRLPSHYTSHRQRRW